MEPRLEMPDLGELNIDHFSVDFTDVRVLAAHLATLQKYAALKAEAMAYRHAGDITSALRCEGECDIVYRNLPSNWRW